MEQTCGTELEFLTNNPKTFSNWITFTPKVFCTAFGTADSPRFFWIRFIGDCTIDQNWFTSISLQWRTFMRLPIAPSAHNLVVFFTEKTYFMCNVAYQIWLIDAAYLKHFFCLKWEKKNRWIFVFLVLNLPLNIVSNLRDQQSLFFKLFPIES